MLAARCCLLENSTECPEEDPGAGGTSGVITGASRWGAHCEAKQVRGRLEGAGKGAQGCHEEIKEVAREPDS